MMLFLILTFVYHVMCVLCAMKCNKSAFATLKGHLDRQIMCRKEDIFKLFLDPKICTVMIEIKHNPIHYINRHVCTYSKLSRSMSHLTDCGC